MELSMQQNQMDYLSAAALEYNAALRQQYLTMTSVSNWLQSIELGCRLAFSWSPDTISDYLNMIGSENIRKLTPLQKHAIEQCLHQEHVENPEGHENIKIKTERNIEKMSNENVENVENVTAGAAPEEVVFRFDRDLILFQTDFPKMRGEIDGETGERKMANVIGKDGNNVMETRTTIELPSESDYPGFLLETRQPIGTPTLDGSRDESKAALGLYKSFTDEKGQSQDVQYTIKKYETVKDSSGYEKRDWSSVLQEEKLTAAELSAQLQMEHKGRESFREPDVTVEFSKKQIISQRDVAKSTWELNPETGKREPTPVLGSDGAPQMEKLTTIRLPSESKYAGYVFSTTKPLQEVQRTKFDPEKSTRVPDGINENMSAIKLYSSFTSPEGSQQDVKLKISHIPKIVDAHGNDVLDEKGRPTYDRDKPVVKEVTAKELQYEFNETWKEANREKNMQSSQQQKDPIPSEKQRLSELQEAKASAKSEKPQAKKNASKLEEVKNNGAKKESKAAPEDKAPKKAKSKDQAR